MAPTFVFKLGTLDLSEYVRVNPDDHLDPYGQPWLQPAFTETPFADGQPLISTTVGNREQMWPLFLKDSSRLKDQLHKLIQQIQIAQGQKPLVVEWRDDGATNSTFFDVAFLRFEPDFNFRRSQHGYGGGVLHIWVSGYGHTGTTRIAGTAAGTGVFLSVPMPSVGGDGPALLDTTVISGAFLPTYGRIVAIAPLSHPSYAPLVPAASLVESQTSATLVGASGAQGSQYLALPVSPTGGASGIACKVPLQHPTIMGGDNRVLAIVKSGIVGGVAINAIDPYGNAMGGTAVASMTQGFGVVDLGVCRLPTVGFPTRPLISILAGGVWASGADGPGILASPAGLAINEIICLPDKNLALVLENSSPGGTIVSQGQTAANTAPLAGAKDQIGNNTWEPALNDANAGSNGTGMNIRSLGNAAPVCGRQTTELGVTASVIDADRISPLLGDTYTISGRAQFGSARFGSEELRLFKDIAASQYVRARLSPGGGFLALEAATGAAAKLIASVAVPTVSAVTDYALSLALEGPKAYINLSRVDGGQVYAPGSMARASIGVASDAGVVGPGAPALAIAIASRGGGITAFYPRISNWLVVENAIVGGGISAYDSYRFDGPDADTYRTASTGVFGRKLVSQQRGAFPKAAPSTSSIAIVCAPFDQGPANDTVSAVVSAKERFFYAR